MHLEDHLTPFDIRSRHDHLTVKPAGPHQCRVENVGTVCCCDKDNALVGFKTVHLDKELVQSLFAFIMPATETGTAMPPYRINFVNKDDARGALFPLDKKVTDTTG